MAGWTSSLLSALLLSLHAVSAATDATTLHVNALVGINGASAFQCWSVLPPFTISTQAGTVGAKIQSIGDTVGSTIVFFNETAPTNAGLHAAPSPQWVFVLSGSGVVTLPTNNKTLDLPSGAILIANDTAAVSKLGHNSQWSKGTVAMQLPFKTALNHTVLNDGPCLTDNGHHHGH